MTGMLNDRATLYRRMPDSNEGAPQQEPIMQGTIRGFAQYLREQPEHGRECFYAELADGKRLSAEEIDRIAINEGA